MVSNENVLEKLSNLESIVYAVLGKLNTGENFNIQNQEEKTYTEKEVSKIMKVGVRTLANWRNDGLIDFHKPHGRIFYTQKNIDDFFEKSKKKAYR